MYASTSSFFDVERLAREYHEMEEAAMKVKTFKQEQQFISAILQEATSLDEEELETTSKISSVLFKNWFPNLLQVGIHNNQRMETFGQWWKTFIGFKDGAFQETGPTPKLHICKDVWSEFNKVYYIDYFLLFNNLVLTNNWKQGNRQ